MGRIQIISIIVSVFILIFVIELVRRRKLKPEYSILWLASAIAIFALSVQRYAIDWFAKILGVYYAPAVLLLVAIGFGIILFIHYSIVISKLSTQVTILAQKIALLETKLKEKGSDKNQTD